MLRVFRKKGGRQKVSKTLETFRFRWVTGRGGDPHLLSPDIRSHCSHYHQVEMTRPKGDGCGVRYSEESRVVNVIRPTYGGRTESFW